MKCLKWNKLWCWRNTKKKCLDFFSLHHLIGNTNRMHENGERMERKRESEMNRKKTHKLFRNFKGTWINLHRMLFVYELSWPGPGLDSILYVCACWMRIPYETRCITFTKFFVLISIIAVLIVNRRRLIFMPVITMILEFLIDFRFVWKSWIDCVLS